jgi:hypothetical protein
MSTAGEKVLTQLKRPTVQLKITSLILLSIFVVGINDTTKPAKCSNTTTVSGGTTLVDADIDCASDFYQKEGDTATDCEQGTPAACLWTEGNPEIYEDQYKTCSGYQVGQHSGTQPSPERVLERAAELKEQLDWVNTPFVGVRFLGIMAILLCTLDVGIELALDPDGKVPGGSASGVLMLVHKTADLGVVTVISVIVHAIVLCSTFSRGNNMAVVLALLSTTAEIMTKDNDSGNSPYSFPGALRSLVGNRPDLQTLGRLVVMGLLTAAAATLFTTKTDEDGIPYGHDDDKVPIAKDFVCGSSIADGTRGLLDPLGVNMLILLALGSETLGLVYKLNTEKRNPIYHYMTLGLVMSIVHTGMVCGDLTLSGDPVVVLGEGAVLLLLIARAWEKAQKFRVASKAGFGHKVQRYRAIDLVTVEA